MLGIATKKKKKFDGNPWVRGALGELWIACSGNPTDEAGSNGPQGREGRRAAWKH